MTLKRELVYLAARRELAAVPLLDVAMNDERGRALVEVLDRFPQLVDGDFGHAFLVDEALDDVARMRVRASERAELDAAAHRAGLSFSDWAREILLAAARGNGR